MKKTMSIIRVITLPDILVCVIIFLIGVILLSIAFTYTITSIGNHNSYHKGYSEAKKDNENYYQTVRDLDNSFSDILKNIKDSQIDINSHVITELVDFGYKIRKYKNKY